VSFKIIIFVINAVVFGSQAYTLQEIRSSALKADSDYNAVRAKEANQEIYKFKIPNTKEVNQDIYEYEIPPMYWNEVIRSINPIRVYDHRLNVVIALKSGDGVEEGIYIFNVESSYAPLKYGTEVEDGFTFIQPSEGSVIKYRRRIVKK
jgi:hypothetical protein